MIRVVAITDRRLCGDIAARVGAILAAVPRGSVAIQIREKDLDGGALLALARELIAVARPLGAPVFVNDRVDVALIAGADGVHLPERGMPIADARQIAPRLRIACSRHDAAGVSAADAELVQYGPIWATPGKGAPIGPEALAVTSRARLVAIDSPQRARLVAVGGIDSPERARLAARAGADAVAVIRAAWRDDGAAAIAAMVRAFDPK